MIQPAPIFLLVDGNEKGPLDHFEVDEILEENDLDETTFSCIEGMKAWRSIAETRLWSYAKMLNNFEKDAREMVERMSSHKLEIREARSELRNLLNRIGFIADPGALDALAEVLYINGYLQKHHRKFSRREQEWDPDVIEAYPAQVFTIMGKQRFPRDWETDWRTAGGVVVRGKMAAIKCHSAWFDISDFGYPFPPFSMDPAAWTEEMSWNEAHELSLVGLYTPVVLPEIKPFNLVGL